jgi:8-oxo-dGTP pyrophosphatase MutT (NUDIX family)
MDLSIQLGNTKLYIRVAGFVKTANGFLFEKSAKGYLYTVGGKIGLNETSEEAIKRELMEEIGMEVKNLNLVAVNENFFKVEDKGTHEICFVYNIEDLFTGEIPEGFVEIPLDDILNHDIRPSSIPILINEGGKNFKHIITDLR